MYKTVKTISFIIAISFAFTAISCLDDSVELEERTPELEAAELFAFLDEAETEGFDVDTSDLGIYYIIYETGSDTLAQAGDTCHLEYTGYLLNGIIFDSSYDHYVDGIWHLIYKDIQLIQGFDDGIALMGKGTVLDMIIPSQLGYGPYGSDIIPPYSTLVFSAKMHDILPKTN